MAHSSLMSPEPGRAKRVSITLPPDLYERLAALAEADRRSVASWAAVQLELAVIEAEEKLRQGCNLKERLADESQRFTAWYRDDSLAERTVSSPIHHNVQQTRPGDASSAVAALDRSTSLSRKSAALDR